MDKENRERYIRDLVEVSEVVDAEISLLAGNDREKEILYHRMFYYVTLLFRLNEVPIAEPGFTDVLRLVANITDLTIEKSLKKNSSNDSDSSR